MHENWFVSIKMKSSIAYVQLGVNTKPSRPKPSRVLAKANEVGQTVSNDSKVTLAQLMAVNKLPQPRCVFKHLLHFNTNDPSHL